MIDLRTDYTPPTFSGDQLNALLHTAGIAKLINGAVSRPSQRSIMYYNPFLFGSFFYPNFHYEAEYGNRYNGQEERPIVFVVNKNSLLPRIAIGLQAKNKAAILQEKGTGDLSGKEIKFYLTDSVLIRMRTGEVANGDGSIGLHTNAYYQPLLSGDAIKEQAKALLSNSFPVLQRPVASSIASAALPNYANDTLLPSVGDRVLAAAMIYGVIDNFYPYKGLMDQNWEKAYRTVLLRFVAAANRTDYLKAVAELYAYTNDGHCRVNHKDYPSLLSSGQHNSPILAKVVENKYVVTSILHDSASRAFDIAKGDIIQSINGKDPVSLIDSLRKFRAASNKDAQTNYLAEGLLMGSEGETKEIKIRKNTGSVKTVFLPASAKFNPKERWVKVNERYTRPTLRFLTKEIGYADLNKLAWYEVDSMFNLFRNTKAIVFDMRGYPQGAGFHIAPRLTESKDVKASKFSTLAPGSPNVKALGTNFHNAERWMSMYGYLSEPGGFIYKGKTVMLIDESAESQAEATAMMFKQANKTMLFGHNTAGANGDVMAFTIPGNISLAFSGDYISWPDGKGMQRIGIVPDVRVRHTIKGIQAGRDEVLERAVKYLKTNR